MKEISITDIKGYRIGHARDAEGGTGCTVIICDKGMTAGISVEGGGPAGRETELLNPKMHCQEISAVCLSGGSAYGLDSASGVMRYLEEKNIGYDVGMGVVPLVPASCLFDLVAGDFNCRPDSDMGYAACVDSEDYEGKSDKQLKGNVGAGTGCTVGKFLGLERTMKSGIGTYAVQQGDLKVGAIVAVNALGDIFDADTGKQIAGMLSEDGEGLASTREVMWNSILQQKNVFTGNTTIGAVICNARLTKAQCHKLASMTQDGYARVIRPVHTTADGDTIYFLADGNTYEGQESVEVNQDALGDLASYVMAKAINDAVRSAESAYGFKAACELKE